MLCFARSLSRAYDVGGTLLKGHRSSDGKCPENVEKVIFFPICMLCVAVLSALIFILLQTRVCVCVCVCVCACVRACVRSGVCVNTDDLVRVLWKY